MSEYQMWQSEWISLQGYWTPIAFLQTFHAFLPETQKLCILWLKQFFLCVHARYAYSQFGRRCCRQKLSSRTATCTLRSKASQIAFGTVVPQIYRTPRQGPTAYVMIKMAVEEWGAIKYCAYITYLSDTILGVTSRTDEKHVWLLAGPSPSQLTSRSLNLPVGWISHIYVWKQQILCRSTVFAFSDGGAADNYSV